MDLQEQEDGRMALIMDKEELPTAVEALMRAGYGLASPSEADGNESNGGEAGPEAPEAEARESEEPEGEPEEEDEPEELEAEADEPEEPEEPDEESEESRQRSPIRRRGSRARRLWADATAPGRIRVKLKHEEKEKADGGTQGPRRWPRRLDHG